MNADDLRALAESAKRKSEEAEKQRIQDAQRQHQARDEAIQREGDAYAERLAKELISKSDELAKQTAEKGERKKLVYAGTHYSTDQVEYFKHSFLSSDFFGHRGKWIKRTPEETARIISKWDKTCLPVFTHLQRIGLGPYFTATPFACWEESKESNAGSIDGTFELWMSW